MLACLSFQTSKAQRSASNSDSNNSGSSAQTSEGSLLGSGFENANEPKAIRKNRPGSSDAFGEDAFAEPAPSPVLPGGGSIFNSPYGGGDIAGGYEDPYGSQHGRYGGGGAGFGDADPYGNPIGIYGDSRRISPEMAARSGYLPGYGQTRTSIQTVAHNYPLLEKAILKETEFSGRVSVKDFIQSLKNDPDIPGLNWLITQNPKIEQIMMPELSFSQISLADLLDALNEFANQSPDYNIHFEAKSNILRVVCRESHHAPSLKRNIKTFPMAELSKKYELNDILTLLHSSLGIPADKSFKNSALRPLYHKETEILMLSLRHQESILIHDLLNTLEANARGKSSTEKVKEQRMKANLELLAESQARMDHLVSEKHELLIMIENLNEQTGDITPSRGLMEAKTSLELLEDKIEVVKSVIRDLEKEMLRSRLDY